MAIMHLLGLALLLPACGCRLDPFWLMDYTETVMSPEMRIEGTNANGSVVIVAGEGTRRTYEGDGFKKTLRLTSRTERWNGSLGMYDPGTSAGRGQVLQAEEGRIHVKSVDEALRWMYQGSAVTKPVYTNSGLVFTYRISEPYDEETQPTVRSVEIWQIYINGKRPTTMPGADDSAIKVTGGEVPDRSEPHPAPVGDPMRLADKPYTPATRPTTRPSAD